MKTLILKHLWLVLIGIVLIAGGLGLGLAWQTNYLDRWLPFEVKEVLGKVEREISNWESYTNKRFGYSFKYPPSWFVYSSFGGQLLWITSFNPNLHVGKSEVGWEEVPEGEVAVLVEFLGDDKAPNQSLEDYLEAGATGVEPNLVRFGGKEWVRVSRDVYTVARSSIDILYISNGINVYGLSLRGALNEKGAPTVTSAENLRLAEYVASTLEFFERSEEKFNAESAPEGSIPGWRVYRNPQLGFVAEYPADWVVEEWGGYVEFSTPDFREGPEVVETPVVGKEIQVDWEWNGPGDGESLTPREMLSSWDPYPYKIRKEIVVDQYPGILYEIDFSSVENSRGVRVGSYISVGIMMYRFDCFAWDVAEKEECAEILEKMLSTVLFVE